MIKKIKVKNFKSLKDFEFDLNADFNLLVGPNTVGKSNIIDAFRILHQISTIPNVFPQIILQRGSFLDILWAGENSEKESNEISFEIEGNIKNPDNIDFKYILKLNASKNFQNIWKEESLSIDDKNIFSVFNNILKTSDNKLHMPNNKPTNADVIINRVLGSKDINIGNMPGLMYAHDGAQYVLEYLKNWQFFDIIPAHVKTSGNVAAKQEFLFPDGNNLSSMIMQLQLKYPNNFERLSRTLSDLLPSVTSVLTEPTQTGNVFINSTEKYLTRPISIMNMSDGELKLLVMLVLTFIPEELAFPLIFMEEPDNYIHAKLLSDFIDIVRQERNIGKDKNKTIPQIVFTTHSPALINCFTTEELFVVKKEMGATKIVDKTTYPKSLEHLIKKEGMGLGELYYLGVLNG